MPPRLAILLVGFCIALNAAGFLFHLFEPIPLYDEIAHFITPFTLVALLAEVIYRWGGDDEFFPTPQRAILTGIAIGFLGAVGWEIIEVILGAGIPPLERTQLPYATLASSILSSSKSEGLL